MDEKVLRSLAPRVHPHSSFVDHLNPDQFAQPPNTLLSQQLPLDMGQNGGCLQDHTEVTAWRVSTHD